MKQKRLIALLLAVVMAAAVLAGCGGQQQSAGSKKQDDKIAISMYMWDRSMLKELSPWLEEKFPEIEFTFVQSFNTMEYYKDLLARG